MEKKNPPPDTSYLITIRIIIILITIIIIIIVIVIILIIIVVFPYNMFHMYISTDNIVYFSTWYAFPVSPVHGGHYYS